MTKLNRAKTFLLFAAVLCCSIISIIAFESCEPPDPPYQTKEGKGDILTCFAYSNNHLYVLNNGYLQLYSVTKGVIDSISRFSIDSYNNNNKSIALAGSTLFITSRDMNYPIDITEPDKPTSISSGFDLKPCDAFVVNEKYLFNTIRIDGDCRFSGNDELRVTDLSNNLMTQVGAYPVQTPYSVSLDGNILFLAGGDNGLTIYDIHDPLSVVVVKQYSDIKGVNVSAAEGVLLVTNSDAIWQYDYADINNLKLLGKIELQ